MIKCVSLRKDKLGERNRREHSIPNVVMTIILKYKIITVCSGLDKQKYCSCYKEEMNNKCSIVNRG